MDNTMILKTNGIDVDKGLELLGDMSMYNSILKEFYDGYYNRMKKIEALKLSSDMANYAIEVHSLKSDSKYLGFTKLAELAYNHEMASKAGDITSVNLHYNELVIEGNRVIRVVQEYFMKNSENPDSNSEASIDTAPSEDVVMISKEDIDNAGQAILVADDSVIIRDFVKEIFHDNYSVLMAKDGREVINIINSNSNIAALLLDLNMPGVDGFAVLDYFKEHDLFKKIPVSIISGANDKASIDKAFSYNIVDMLNKPFNKNNVKLVVEKTIASKSI